MKKRVCESSFWYTSIKIVCFLCKKTHNQAIIWQSKNLDLACRIDRGRRAAMRGRGQPAAGCANAPPAVIHYITPSGFFPNFQLTQMFSRQPIIKNGRGGLEKNITSGNFTYRIIFVTLQTLFVCFLTKKAHNFYGGVSKWRLTLPFFHKSESAKNLTCCILFRKFL